MPKVSVVMPVGPNREYLPEAIRSIESQTFRDFEWIMDDGPAYRKALNDGCRKATGEFIAIMNADDISYPTRLERQVDFLDSHPDISVVGTWGDRIGTRSGVCHPPGNVTLSQLFMWDRVIHSSAMMRRKDVLPFGPYRQVLHEDWDLWIRLVRAGRKVRNITEPLVAFRFSPGSLVASTGKLAWLGAQFNERLACFAS